MKRKSLRDSAYWKRLGFSVLPKTERIERKVAFVKRVVAYGLPILVGSGYYLDEGP